MSEHDLNLKEVGDFGELSGDKRQYFPYVLEWNCPDCGNTNEHDLREYYLSYPEWGGQETVPLFCNDCDHIEPVLEPTVRPNITLELIE